MLLRNRWRCERLSPSCHRPSDLVRLLTVWGQCGTVGWPSCLIARCHHVTRKRVKNIDQDLPEHKDRTLTPIPSAMRSMQGAEHGVAVDTAAMTMISCDLCWEVCSSDGMHPLCDTRHTTTLCFTLTFYTFYSCTTCQHSLARLGAGLLIVGG